MIDKDNITGNDTWLISMQQFLQPQVPRTNKKTYNRDKENAITDEELCGMSVWDVAAANDVKNSLKITESPLRLYY